MSRRMKVLVSVLVAILLLVAVGTATVMAQEDEEPAPPAETNGLLARVAEILDVPKEALVNAFKQARQEMRQEAFFQFLDKAVAEGLLTQEEADEIKEWLEQKPEAMDQNLLRRAFGFMGKRNGQRPGPPWQQGTNGEWQRPGPPWRQGMRQPPGQEL